MGQELAGQDLNHVFIGSVKSNIGHLEAGAGVLGFIKAIMVIQNALIPLKSNLAPPNTKINWGKSLLKAATELTLLPANGIPRRAAIASYGYGETVSLAVIEAAPILDSLSIRRLLLKPHTSENFIMLLLSTLRLQCIKVAAASLANWLKSLKGLQDEQIDKDSVAYTLAVKRGHHKFRTAIVAKSSMEAIELLLRIRSR